MKCVCVKDVAHLTQNNVKISENEIEREKMCIMYETSVVVSTIVIYTYKINFVGI